MARLQPTAAGLCLAVALAVALALPAAGALLQCLQLANLIPVLQSTETCRLEYAIVDLQLPVTLGDTQQQQVDASIIISI
jgi:hypothetical protein